MSADCELQSITTPTRLDISEIHADRFFNQGWIEHHADCHQPACQVEVSPVETRSDQRGNQYPARGLHAPGTLQPGPWLGEARRRAACGQLARARRANPRPALSRPM